MHVMLDLETMGSGPDAAIVAIGAIEFNPTTAELGRTFYRVISLETAVRGGGKIDPSTVIWWLGQSDLARREICKEGVENNVVLLEFAAWLKEIGGDVKVWGNGAAFDNVILAESYRRACLPVPWRHWNDRCYRTLKALKPHVKMERIGTHHNALDDATSQAIHALVLLASSK